MTTSGQTADVTIGFTLSNHVDASSQHIDLDGPVLPHDGYIDAASGITRAMNIPLQLGGQQIEITGITSFRRRYRAV